MNIYDCFMYFDEDMLLDLRLTILNSYVKRFIITEATYPHSGAKIKLNSTKIQNSFGLSALFSPVVTNNFIIEKDIPIIFGNKILNIKNSKLIICGLDIFASIFFMISRWEEYVNLIRDNHARFPATESLAYNNGLLERAVVDE